MISNGIHNNSPGGEKSEEVLDLYWYALNENCPLAMVNEHGRISYVNNRFKAATGYSLNDVQGPMSDLLHPDFHHEDFKKELEGHFRSGKTWRRKICLRHRDGHVLDFFTTSYPSPQGDPSRQQLVIFIPENNMSPEMPMPGEHDLKYFSTLAHDLRNPLNNISALCGLLLDTPLNEKQQDFVSKMKGATSQLSEKIDTLFLSFLKIPEDEQVVSRPFNLKETMEALPSMYSQKVSNQGIIARIETDENLPPEVFGDEKRLLKIFLHIIDYIFERAGLHSLRITALKEAGNGERCEISFFFLGQYSDGTNEISASEDSSQLEPRTDLDEIRSEVAEMQGKILLEEEKPKAFYFHFLLPFQLSETSNNKEEARSPEIPEAEFPGDARILVAEDVELNQLVMKHQLKKIGIEGDFVRTGFNVLERLKEYQYDLILMDVQMPGMNGLQTIEAIRFDKTKPWHQIPIIGITASIGENARQQCLKAGADDFVPKPYNLEDLRLKLLRLISAYRQKASPKLENPPKETDMTDQQKYFDLTYLEEISEGDRDFSATMISYFIENTPSELKKLDKKVQEQDWNEVRQIAHKLKPQVVYMGIHEIEEDVELVEHQAQRCENLEEIPPLVEKISQTISKAIGQLEEELKNFS